MKRILLLIVLSYSSLALAQNVAELTQRALNNDEKAAFTLAHAYYTGDKVGNERVSQDDVKAIQFAARAGHRGAALLGVYIKHLESLSSETLASDSKLMEQLHALANAGVASMYALLGDVYLSHLGNISEALKWLDKSAAQGDQNAIGFLGHLYFNGKVVPRDDFKAFGYLSQLEHTDNFKALYPLGLSYLWGRGVRANQEKGIRLLEKSALSGYLPSQLILGIFYFTGKYVTKNVTKAKKWLTLAAREDSQLVQFYLGLIAFEEKDSQAVYNWFEKAAQQTPGASLPYIHYSFYMMGQYAQLEDDFAKAVMYYKKAAAKDSLGATRVLAIAYQEGLLGLTKNEQLASLMFGKILNLKTESTNIFYNQALLYKYGYGVSADAQRYRELLEKSVALQNPENIYSWEDISPQQLLADIHSQELLKEEEELKQKALPVPTVLSKEPIVELKKEAPEEQKKVVAAEPAAPVRMIDEDFVSGLVSDYNTQFEVIDKSKITALDFYKKTITIDDPRNKSTIVVTFEEQGYFPFKRRKFIYDTRVEDYFSNSLGSLKAKGKSEDDILTHGFAQIMDCAISLYGRKVIVPDMNGVFVANYIMPGEIITHDNKHIPGTFEYAFYRKGGKLILYHRFFRKQH